MFAEHRCFFGASKVAYRKAILDQILPIPEGAVIEADEYLLLLAPFFADALVLNQALFHYRLHGGNMYMQGGATEASSCRLYKSLACLVENLTRKLRELGVPREIDESLLTPIGWRPIACACNSKVDHDGRCLT